MTIAARPYQIAAQEAVERELDTHPSTLVVMPTGTGKTVLFGLIAQARAEQKQRVLVLAHREELVDQAASTLRGLGLSVEVEMAERRARADEGLFGRSDVVVASVQSMARRLERWPRDAFSLVVTDEAHHAVASQYVQVSDHFASAKKLGVTATPDRADEQALGQVFQSSAFRYEIWDAIRDGWLAPVRAERIQLKGVKLDRVGVRAGDLKAEGIAREFSGDEQLIGTANVLLEKRPNGRMMVFTGTVGHAHALAAVLNKQAGKVVAQALDGEIDRDERRRTLADWRAGQFDILINCALFTEGFDEWSIQTVALLRPTKSRALYAQMVGRGTRLCPTCKAPCEHKPHLTILDFTGASKKHRLVGPADVLGGEYTDITKKPKRKKPTKQERAEQKLREGGKERPVRNDFPSWEAYEGARVKYEAELVDLMGAADQHAEQTHFSGLSDSLTKRLVAFGVPADDIAKLHPARAGALFRELIRRAQAEPRLCSYKQGKLLLKNGWTKEQLVTLTFDEASQRIEELMRKWREKAA